MKTILIHLDPGNGVESVLTTSRLCGQKFQSYLEATHRRLADPGLVVAGADGFVAAAPDLIASLQREIENQTKEAKDAFETFMKEHRIERRSSEGADQGLCAAWNDRAIENSGSIGERARVFDLAIVTTAADGSPPHRTSILEAVLFDGGRPVLIAPPEPPQSLGKRIVIAWNCSTETARTVGFATDFLKAADHVTILTVEDAVVQGPPASDLAQNLRHHGINCALVDADCGSMSPGERILSECARLDCDLLIKGAFTHSRIRQMIFGGATSHIIDHAAIPVLMAN